MRVLPARRLTNDAPLGDQQGQIVPRLVTQFRQADPRKLGPDARVHELDLASLLLDFLVKPGLLRVGKECPVGERQLFQGREADLGERRLWYVAMQSVKVG